MIFAPKLSFDEISDILNMHVLFGHAVLVLLDVFHYEENHVLDFF